jgi:hypothetical protein
MMAQSLQSDCTDPFDQIETHPETFVVHQEIYWSARLFFLPDELPSSSTKPEMR